MENLVYKDINGGLEPLKAESIRLESDGELSKE
jgi:hypothetical protein